jgi:glucan 1,3-beta-glucosidase
LHTSAHTLRRYDLLKQACIWAGNAGLKVLIDLHGAPGSQNGFDHSGRKRSRQHWTDNRSNIDRTLAIISTMAKEFSQDKYRSSVAAIELLNEPNGMNLDVLKQVSQPCGSAELPR